MPAWYPPSGWRYFVHPSAPVISIAPRARNRPPASGLGAAGPHEPGPARRKCPRLAWKGLTAQIFDETSGHPGMPLFIAANEASCRLN